MIAYNLKLNLYAYDLINLVIPGNAGHSGYFQL